MYTDRLREAAYTTPSGLRLPFIYEDVSMNFDAKGTAFEFADSKTYVQRKICTLQRFPMTLIINGPDYDRDAKAMIDNLKAIDGDTPGKLEHPIYGVFNVLPLGQINRSDRLKTAGMEAHISVTFYETSQLKLSSPSLFDEINGFIDDFDQMISDIFVNNIYISKVSEAIAMGDYISKRVASLGGDIGNMFGLLPKVKQQVNTVQQSIERSISGTSDLPGYIGSLPAGAVASQIFKMQLPAAKTKTQPKTNRAAAFTKLALKQTGISDVEPGGKVSTPSINSSDGDNTYQVASLVTSQAIVCASLASIYTEWENQDQALYAALSLADSLDQIIEWQDKNLVSLNVLDTGEGYQATREITLAAISLLMNDALNLPPSKMLFIDRDRTIIDVAAEVYGDISSATLDKLINNNDLSGDKILSLSYGDNIIYYE